MDDLFKATLQKHKDKGAYTYKAVVLDLMEQVFRHYNVGTVIINDRIVNEFKCKLWRMDKAISKAKGGKQKQTLLKKWTNRRLSVWEMKIYYSEVDNIGTKRENDKLNLQKHKLEDELDQMATKVAKLEAQVDKEHNSASVCKKKIQKTLS